LFTSWKLTNLHKWYSKNEEEESDNDEIADTFNEIKDTDLHAGNMDTLLDEIEDEGNPKYDT
jgi:hypothetical protein